ncbi:MAG: hypothetical protein ACK5N0_00270 [Synechococcaceae cyanobacterium]
MIIPQPGATQDASPTSTAPAHPSRVGQPGAPSSRPPLVRLASPLQNQRHSAAVAG